METIKTVLLIGATPSEAHLISGILAASKGIEVLTINSLEARPELPAPSAVMVIRPDASRQANPLAALSFARMIGSAMAAAPLAQTAEPLRLEIPKDLLLAAHDHVDLAPPKEPWRDGGVNSKRHRGRHGGNVGPYKGIATSKKWS